MSDATDGAPQTLSLKDRVWTYGAQSFRLRYSTLAMWRLKEAWKIEGDLVLSRRVDAGRLDDGGDLLWAMCARHHPEKTRDECRIFFDDLEPENMKSLRAVFKDCLIAAWPPPPKKKTEAKAES